MGLLAAVTFDTRRASARLTTVLVTIAVAASLGAAFAADDETVVVPLIADLGSTGYELGLDTAREPSIQPCYPTNQPFLGAADDPVLVGRDGDAVVFQGRWIDPSRFLVEPPDDEGDTGAFTPPTSVAFQLTVPWTGEFTTLDHFANPADRETGTPLLQVDLSNAASAYRERGGREQEGADDPR